MNLRLGRYVDKHAWERRTEPRTDRKQRSAEPASAVFGGSRDRSSPMAAACGLGQPGKTEARQALQRGNSQTIESNSSWAADQLEGHSWVRLGCSLQGTWHDIEAVQSGAPCSWLM